MTAATFDSIRQKTAALQEQIKALQAEAAEQIKPLLMQFIVDNPQVESVRWTQYTPYFNDGDTCEFGVNEPQFKFVSHEDGGDYEDGFFDLPYQYDPSRDYYKSFCEACPRELYVKCQALSKELSGLEDALKTLFGDHVRVIVTKDGVEVEEYEHD